MAQKMKAVVLHAKWDPKPEFSLGPKDVDGKLTYLGNKVWRYPEVKVEEVDVPQIEKPTEVIIEVKASGICGSDVHMAQAEEDGYIFYPGLTAFPTILGHEFSGVIKEAGDEAINKRTKRRFEPGEPVMAEEMLWCGHCKPCVDGYPNHCENLQELGFSVPGSFAQYLKVDAKYVWSLHELTKRYSGEELFLAGSLVEPASVAYNGIVNRAGGIQPGQNAVVVGAGPIGLSAVNILKHMGAARVIVSEPSEARREYAKKVGADFVIDPLKENFKEAVLEYTEGMGASLYIEASGVGDIVIPQIEDVIWEARGINATLLVIARAPKKVLVNPEVYQVRRARMVGTQGHSGHGVFPNVISLMGAGLDMRPIITKKITLDEVPEYLKLLQTDKSQVKVTALL